jgi:hypothetical protein
MRLSLLAAPYRRLAFLPLLLAAVMSTALMSAGQARAVLENGPATCAGLGEGFCLPGATQEILNQVFIVSDRSDPLFNITADETTIILEFPDPVTGMDMDAVGFRLSNLQSNPDLVLGEITDVDFINFFSEPTTRPFVTNVGGIQIIQWTLLAGMDPQLGSIARINLTFVPEPGTALLMGLGLAGLGVFGRSRRDDSETTV